MMAPPFRVWIDTNLGRVMMLPHSPNGKADITDFLRGQRRNFADFEFYLTDDHAAASSAIVQPAKYLECYSTEISTWKRVPNNTTEEY